MSTSRNSQGGPGVLSNVRNTPIQTLNANAAGRDVIDISPIINFNGPVHMSSGGGSSLDSLLSGPYSAKPTAQRAGILRNIACIFTSRRSVTSKSAKTGALKETGLARSSLAAVPTDKPLEDAPRSPEKVTSDDDEKGGDSGVFLSLMKDLDPQSLGWNRLTTPEIYVCSLLGSGRGLACWDPRPKRWALCPEARSVAVGDVGTFSATGGFKKAFNLWDDQSSVQETAIRIGQHSYTIPLRHTPVVSNVLQSGHAVVMGATSKTSHHPNTANLALFEFQCQSQRGAALALTTSADSEDQDDLHSLREYIMLSAETIYTHFNAIRTIDEEEPLYIVTGSDKSESCGLFAYRQGTESQYNIARLEHRPCGPNSFFWAWTDRGTTEAHYYGSEKTDSSKEMSLFLRGFKLDFSLDFRTKMRRQATDRLRASEARARAQESTSGRTIRGASRPGGTQRNPDAPNARDGQTGGRGSSRGSRPSNGGHTSLAGQGASSLHQLQGLRIQAFPDTSRQVTCHPCDIITEYLLKVTGESVALSHDDDWRFLMQGKCLWEGSGANASNENVTPVEEVCVLSQVSVRHGVAYLRPAEEEPGGHGDAQHNRPEASIDTANNMGNNANTSDKATTPQLPPSAQDTMKVFTEVLAKDPTSELSESTLRTLALLGGEARVQKVLHTPSGTIMAKKILNVDCSPSVRKRILRELHVMSECKSPYIVSFYGSFLVDASVSLCLEYMDKGSLSAIVERVGALPLEMVGAVALSVLEGLKYLYETHQVIHRDVQPSNILLNSEGKIKLCDFGTSGELINSIANSFVAASMYMSPERITGQEYTVKADVWSLGICLIELAIGSFPFRFQEDVDTDHEIDTPTGGSGSGKGCTKRRSKRALPQSDALSIIELMFKIVNEPSPRLPEGRFPRDAEELVDACLVKDANERGTPAAILSLPWISSLRKSEYDVRAFAATI